MKIDLATRNIVGYLTLQPEPWTRSIGRQIKKILGRPSAMAGSMPQDIRSSPDGRTFYAADMKDNGVFVIDPSKFQRLGFIPTGIGAHGIYPSRDGTKLYVTNRGWNTIAGGHHGPGSISVLDPEIIVVGGGISQIGEPLFSRLRAITPTRSINQFAAQTPIVPAMLALHWSQGWFGASVAIGISSSSVSLANSGWISFRGRGATVFARVSAFP